MIKAVQFTAYFDGDTPDEVLDNLQGELHTALDQVCDHFDDDEAACFVQYAGSCIHTLADDEYLDTVKKELTMSKKGPT